MKLYINDLNKLKITRVRDWRINFKYDNVLYSFNCHEDGSDSSTVLINWDTKEVIKGQYGNLYVNNYIKVNYNNYNKPTIYSHIDKEYFVKQLYKNGFVMCGKKIHNEVIQDKIYALKNDIINLEREIEEKKQSIKQMYSLIK